MLRGQYKIFSKNVKKSLKGWFAQKMKVESCLERFVWVQGFNLGIVECFLCAGGTKWRLFGVVWWWPISKHCFGALRVFGFESVVQIAYQTARLLKSCDSDAPSCWFEAGVRGASGRCYGVSHRRMLLGGQCFVFWVHRGCSRRFIMLVLGHCTHMNSFECVFGAFVDLGRCGGVAGGGGLAGPSDLNRGVRYTFCTSLWVFLLIHLYNKMPWFCAAHNYTFVFFSSISSWPRRRAP